MYEVCLWGRAKHKITNISGSVNFMNHVMDLISPLGQPQRKYDTSITYFSAVYTIFIGRDLGR